MPLPSPSSVLLRTQSDERLVVLARAGHERAFEAIVERYRGGLLRVARRYLPDARAEDALQQAFLAAWSALQRGDDVRDLRAWMHRIARNSALNQLRATGYDYAELEESLRAADAPADAVERRNAMRQTLTGLAALPERQREALLRIAVEGRSQDEVARELGVSSGAVRQLVHRARHTLRAAATAVVPMPVATWLASGGGAAAEAVGGAGAAAVFVKGAAVLLATGVAATPIIVAAEPDRSGHPPARHAAASGGRDPISPSPASALPTASPRGSGEHEASGSSERAPSGRSRSGRSGSGSSGKSRHGGSSGRGGGSSGGSDSSGPGPSGSGGSPDGSGDSSGPGGGDDSSGSGSGGSSGSGSSGSSSGGGDSSGSGSSGSGSSGTSGSGSSGSGSSGSGSSGSGSSSGPGPGPTPTPTAAPTITVQPDNSGPGSLDSGSSSSGPGGGDDSSGHGSSGGPGHG